MNKHRSILKKKRPFFLKDEGRASSPLEQRSRPYDDRRNATRAAAKPAPPMMVMIGDSLTVWPGALDCERRARNKTYTTSVNASRVAERWSGMRGNVS